MPTDLSYNMSGRPRWAMLTMGVAAVASSLLAVIALYHVLTLKAEVASLRAECRDSTVERIGDAQALWNGEQSELQPRAATDTPKTELRENRSKTKKTVFQPCLQMLADQRRSIVQKDHKHTAIPWQVGLSRGDALVWDTDAILVREEGFYFVYSQVFYMDKTFAMGHIINRIKQNIVGSELQKITLFRCVQNMSEDLPFNTCYTAGVVKLEAGDSMELLVPRQPANVSLDGDVTFFGAIRLLLGQDNFPHHRLMLQEVMSRLPRLEKANTL